MFFKLTEENKITCVGKSDVVSAPFEQIDEAEYSRLLAEIKDRAAVVKAYVDELRFPQADMTLEEYEQACLDAVGTIPALEEDKDYFKPISEEVFSILMSLYEAEDDE